MLHPPTNGRGSSRTPAPPADLNRVALPAGAVIRPDSPEQVPDLALCWINFPYFLSQLKDDRGERLVPYWHIVEWADLMSAERLLALLASRDHGKTYTAWAYILWRCWRHNRAPNGDLLEHRPEGNFDFIYFTANMPLAIERFQRLQQFILDNEHLFGDILPRREPGQPMAALRDQWSKTKFRLRNGAAGQPKSIGSAYRGPHPQLIVADDIVSEKNARTPLQRGRVWSYFVGTIMPMAGPSGQILLLGTPQHYTDTLFRIKEAPGWRWVKYRAVDWDTARVLWPERYSVEALRDIAKTDPVLFSREYQMDPRDDASSIFPYSLTEFALAHGLRFVRPFPLVLRQPGDYVLLAEDLAVSESVGADYTVIFVGLYNRYTQKRRLLWALRERGLSFDEQVSLLRDVCRDFNVDLGVIEQNVFQKWLHQHIARFPETASRIFGHTTGIERQSREEGIPGLKIVLQNKLWEMPYAGLEERELVDAWRAELNGFGFADGRLQSAAEHDDTVTAFWLFERAIRLLEAHLPVLTDEIITGEDVGIHRVKITDAY